MRRRARADRAPGGRASRRRIAPRGALVAGSVVLLAAGVLAFTQTHAHDGPARHGRLILIDVPRGTAARIAAGQRVNIIPDRIVAHVGDTLRLVNHDSVPHMVGPFLVSPGQTLTSALARAGTYTGTCTLHPGRRISIVVRA